MPPPGGEAARLEALRRYAVLDTPPERTFDDLTLLASHVCGTPIALLTLIDADRQWFKSRVGLSVTETPRSLAFCDHAIRQDGPMVVRDALADPRFASNPLVTSDPRIRFYGGVPLKSPEGHALGTLCVIDRMPRDLSAGQREALEALARQASAQLELRRLLAEAKESEDRFRQIAENIREVFWMTDPAKNRMLYISPGYETIWGRSCAELYANPRAWLDAIHPDDRDRVLQAALTRQAGGDYQEEYRIVRPDGTTRWIRDRAFPVRDDQGVVRRIAGLAADITVEREEAAALADNERRYRLVAEATRDAAMWDWELATGAVRWNDGVRILFGYAPAEVGGDAAWWSERIHPEDRARVLKGIDAALAGGTGIWSDEYRFRRADGSHAVVLDRAVVVRDASGKPARMVGAMTDVSRQRILEEQFRQAQKMEAVGRLAGGVAHDFNNLLTVINGYSQLLLHGLPAGAREREGIDEIRKAGDRAAGLTRQLLAFSRRQALQPRVLDLNAVVADAEKMLRRIVGEDVEVVSRPAPGLGRVKADPGQIEQVLMNLAVNARDAMPRGGTLTIGTANVALDEAFVLRHPGVRPGPYVRLAVGDTGHGMDAAVLSRIFEPFFTTKELGKGTGLGLSTVYGIVQQSGGAIDVESRPGRGAVFRVYLPRVDEIPAAAVSGAGAAAPRGDETILLVEDEAAVRKLAAATLRGQGYRVLEAADGVEALEASGAHAGPIHLLVTDTVMPRMGGRELADRLGPVRPALRVLFTSGYTDDTTLRHGVADTDAAFLQKPFSVEALARAVRNTLDGRK